MSKTHISITGTCKSPAYRGNIYYMAGDKITYDYPIAKGSKGIPAWLDISEESLEALKKAEKEVKEEKVAKPKAKAAPKVEQSLV
jgi:hypothetical protein